MRDNQLGNDENQRIHTAGNDKANFQKVIVAAAWSAEYGGGGCLRRCAAATAIPSQNEIATASSASSSSSSSFDHFHADCAHQKQFAAIDAYAPLVVLLFVIAIVVVDLVVTFALLDQPILHKIDSLLLLLLPIRSRGRRRLRFDGAAGDLRIATAAAVVVGGTASTATYSGHELTANISFEENCHGGGDVDEQIGAHHRPIQCQIDALRSGTGIGGPIAIHPIRIWIVPKDNKPWRAVHQITLYGGKQPNRQTNQPARGLASKAPEMQREHDARESRPGNYHIHVAHAEPACVRPCVQWTSPLGEETGLFAEDDPARECAKNEQQPDVGTGEDEEEAEADHLADQSAHCAHL